MSQGNPITPSAYYLPVAMYSLDVQQRQYLEEKYLENPIPGLGELEKQAAALNVIPQVIKVLYAARARYRRFPNNFLRPIGRPSMSGIEVERRLANLEEEYLTSTKKGFEFVQEAMDKDVLGHKTGQATPVDQNSHAFRNKNIIVHYTFPGSIFRNHIEMMRLSYDDD